MQHSLFSTARRIAVCLMFGADLVAGATAAKAQAIVMSVNGSPITSVDIDQQMKLLRAMRKPATREAATESMIEDRLKASEAAHFGINLPDEEIGDAVQSAATRLKMTPTQLLTGVQSAGVSNAHARSHFKAQLGYSILIRALNKGVEASEVAVRSELAKEKGKGGATSYTVRQVVFTVNPGEGPAALNTSIKQAEALRTRFTSCDSGIPYAKSLPGVAVRAKIVRSSAQLPDAMKEVLDKTPVGHVTPPSRSPNGVEVIALCERSASRNDEDLRKTIAERLLAEHMAQTEQAKYKEMRARAVISRGP